MSDVESALSAEQWADGRYDFHDGGYIARDPLLGGAWVASGSGPPTLVSGSEIPSLIAIANDALRDGDPRKITREHVANLERLATVVDGAGQDPVGADELRDVANVLRSILPPKERR